MFFGIILVIIGIIALLVQLDILPGSVWNYTWPAILIILGVSFLFGRKLWRRPRRWFGPNQPDERDTTKKE
jgi:hypothetical protein